MKIIFLMKFLVFLESFVGGFRGGAESRHRSRLRLREREYRSQITLNATSSCLQIDIFFLETSLFPQWNSIKFNWILNKPLIINSQQRTHVDVANTVSATIAMSEWWQLAIKVCRELYCISFDRLLFDNQFLFHLEIINYSQKLLVGCWNANIRQL